MTEHHDVTTITHGTTGPQSPCPQIYLGAGYISQERRTETTQEPRLSEIIPLKKLVEVLAAHGVKTDYYRLRRRVMAGDIPSYSFGETRVTSWADLPEIIAALVRKPEPKSKARARRLSDRLAG